MTIQSMPPNKNWYDNYDRIFKKQSHTCTVCSEPVDLDKQDFVVNVVIGKARHMHPCSVCGLRSINEMHWIDGKAYCPQHVPEK